MLFILLLVLCSIISIRSTHTIIKCVNNRRIRNGKYCYQTQWVYSNYMSIVYHISNKYDIDISTLHIQIMTYDTGICRYADYVTTNKLSCIRIYLFNIEDNFRIGVYYRYFIIKCIIHELIHHHQHNTDKDVFKNYILPEDDINGYMNQLIEKDTDKIVDKIISENLVFIFKLISK